MFYSQESLILLGIPTSWNMAPQPLWHCTVLILFLPLAALSSAHLSVLLLSPSSWPPSRICPWPTAGITEEFIPSPALAATPELRNLKTTRSAQFPFLANQTTPWVHPDISAESARHPSSQNSFPCQHPIMIGATNEHCRSPKIRIDYLLFFFSHPVHQCLH